MSLVADRTEETTAVEVAYPSLREAAELIGVSASTLSRRDDLVSLSAGRERRVPAAEVVRLAANYKNVPVSRVAALLIERVAREEPEIQEQLEREVDEALEATPPTYSVSGDLQSFVRDAERHLPADLAAQVKAAVNSGEERRLRSVTGWTPDSAD